MGAFSKQLGLAVVLAVAAFAVPTSVAHATGTLTVSITGAGAVEGDGIKCGRTVGGSTTGDCTQLYSDEQDCDPERKPPCINIPAFAVVSADAAPGFAFDHWTGACAAEAATCSISMPRNLSTTAVFRDAASPAVALGQPGAGPIVGTMNLSANATDNVAIDRVEFKVRGVLVATDTSAPFTGSFDTKTVADGAAAVTATAFDTSGLSATTSAVNVVIDNTKPALTVGGPNNTTFGPGTTQNWTIAAADPASGLFQVRCSLVTAGSPVSFAACSGGNAAHSATGKPHGSYVLTVRATDDAGNFTELTRTFSIDAIAPETTIDSGVDDGATTTSTSLTWAMSASEAGATFECRVFPAALTPGAFAPCSSGTSHTASGFAPGVYTFETRATDAVGNVETTSVKRTFTVEEAPPPPAGGGGTDPGSGGSGGPGGGSGGGETTTPGAQLTTVTTTTTTTTVGGPQIVVTLAFGFSNSTKKQTKLTSLVVKNVPAGSTVTAKCPKGCAKKSFTKTNASGQVSLATLIKKPVKVNAVITVVISKPGSGSAVKILKIRARKSPKLTSQCQPVGATKPAAC